MCEPATDANGGTPGDRERAVSPVVGVLLLVSVTVVLASVAGVGVLDSIDEFGTGSVSASLSVSADADSDTIEIAHEGGDPIDSSATLLVVANDTVTQRFPPTSASTFLERGETATVDLARTAGHNRVDWNGSTDSWEYERPGAYTGISPDEELHLLVVSQPGKVPLFRGSVPVDGSSAGSTPGASPTPTPTPTATPTPTPTPQPNQPPDARFTYERKGVSHNVDLNASESRDPDGTVSSYEWDVGDDGSVEYTGETVKNANVQVGQAVSLVVTDDDGGTDTNTTVVP